MIVFLLVLSLQDDPAELIRRLGEESVQARDEAEQALKRLGDKARAALAEAAEKHPDPEVRQRARSILAAMEWEPLFPPYLEKDGLLLLPDLAGKDPKARLRALRTLQKKHPYRLDPLLARFLDDPDPEIAIYAAAHLVGIQRTRSHPDTRLPTEYRPAVLGIVRLLARWDKVAGAEVPFDSPFPETGLKVGASELLHRLPLCFYSLRRSDWPHVSTLADHPDARIRSQVARAAWSFGPEAVPTLQKLARDGDDAVRASAEGPLAHIGGTRVDWKEKLSSDRPADRLRAAAALRESGDESGLQVLLDLVRETDVKLRRGAATELARFKDPGARAALALVRDEAIKEFPRLKDEERDEVLTLLCALADAPSTRAVLDATRGRRPSNEDAWNPTDAELELVRPDNVREIFTSAVEEGNEEFARVLISGYGKTLRRAAVDEAVRVLMIDRRPEWRSLAGRVLRGQADGVGWDGEPGEAEALRERLRPVLRGIVSAPDDPAFDFAIGAAEELGLSDLAPELVASLRKRHSTVAIDALGRWEVQAAAPVLRGIIEAYRGKEKEAVYTYLFDSPLWGNDEENIVARALGALAAVGGTEDIPAALRLLRETQSRAAGALLARFGDESLRGMMRELLASAKEAEVEAGLKLAKKLAGPDELPLLRALLEKPRRTVEAARLLIELKDRESVPLLRKVLAGREAGRFERSALLVGLKELGDDAAEKEALRHLANPDKNFQEPALKAVAALRTREALPLLRRLARTEFGYDAPRGELVHALAEVGGREALPDLLAAFQADGRISPYVRAFLALEAREAVPPMMDLLGMWEAAHAVDRIVNAEFYRRFAQPFGKMEVPLSPGAVAAVLRKTFAVEVEVSPALAVRSRRTAQIPGGQGLGPFLDLAFNRRHFGAPFEVVVRENRLWICTREEAIRHVRDGWERNKAGFK